MIMFFVPTTKTDLVYMQYDVQLKLTYIGSNLMGGMKEPTAKDASVLPSAMVRWIYIYAKR